MRCFVPGLIVIALLAIHVGNARADEAGATYFPRGAFALTLEGDYAHSFDLSRERIESGSVGVGYYFLDNNSISAEFAGFAVQQAGGDSAISEANFRLRTHFLQAGPFSFYVDGAAGVSIANNETPRGGTYYNYVLQIGPGVAYRLQDHLFLMGGARYWHLSNAQIQGSDRNPSINAIEGYVGLMLTF